ncbi:hypothetical protein V5O48_017779, partial [Marasmius crinis-equi]
MPTRRDLRKGSHQRVRGFSDFDGKPLVIDVAGHSHTHPLTSFHNHACADDHNAPNRSSIIRSLPSRATQFEP